ncbi:MAG: alpha/beta hydrolase [Clostridiales bacterium]|nr:alpha/beta hydrolase [Clostridiales bacterium]
MYIAANGMKLWYETRGSGRPLLLLHGNGEDHTVFSTLSKALEGEFRIWSVDSRGHGRSTKTGEISYALMARDIAEFLPLAGCEKPLCVGFSDGGIVGLMLAGRYPGLLGGLIACGANASPRGLSNRFRAVTAAKNFFARDPLLRLMLNEPNISNAELESIAVPTLITAGSRDLIKREETLRIARAIPGAEVRIFSGETHSSYIVGSAKLAPVIRGFASRKGLR